MKIQCYGFIYFSIKINKRIRMAEKMEDKEEGVTVINGKNKIENATIARESRAKADSPRNNIRTRSSSPEPEQPKRFLNGWSKEQERLMSEWSDIALCYRWIHDKSEKIYHGKSLWINLPVIILTTLGGTANFGIQSMFSDDKSKQYASFAIGGISLFAGLLTTIGNYLRYAQLEESHRVASIAWGKFQRLIAIELALNPNERMDSLDFLKICRADLDRLIEQSPPIPQDAISLFEERFSSIPNLKRPDICGALEHTHVFESSDARLKQVAVDAAIMLKQRRNMLTELTMPKIQERINHQIDARLQQVLSERRKSLEEEIELDKLKAKQTQDEYNRILEERHKKIEEEIELEKKKHDTPLMTARPDESRYESRLSLKKALYPLPILGKTQTMDKYMNPYKDKSADDSIVISPRKEDNHVIPQSKTLQDKSIESFVLDSTVNEVIVPDDKISVITE